MAGNHSGQVRLVVFDLDGTLLRGDSVLVALAHSIGRAERMIEMEQGHTLVDIKANAEEMAAWYMEHGRGSVEAGLSRLTPAAGADEGFQRLRDAGIETAIVSVTWQFAVEHFARRFGADYHAGSGLDWETGEISYFVSGCKKPWLQNRMATLGYGEEQVVAVGDSPLDFGLYELAGLSFHVGNSDPELERVRNRPDSGIHKLVEEIMDL